MEPKWYSSGMFHNAGTLRIRWVCSSCGGVRCEIMLSLNDDPPEHCLKENLNET